MALNDNENSLSNQRLDMKAGDKFIGELWRVTLELPDIPVSTDVNEWLGWITEGFNKFI